MKSSLHEFPTFSLLFDWLWFKPDNLAGSHASKEKAEGPFLFISESLLPQKHKSLFQVPKL